MTLIFWLIAFWNWPGAGARSRSRKIFKGSEPEPPKIGRLRNSGMPAETMYNSELGMYLSFKDL